MELWLLSSIKNGLLAQWRSQWCLTIATHAVLARSSCQIKRHSSAIMLQHKKFVKKTKQNKIVQARTSL